MGIIGSIRKHSWVAVALVGVAILAFIFQDLSKNRGSIPDVGVVNGETMTSQRFNELVTEMEDNYKMQQRTTQIPAELEMQIRDQVWQNFVDETLMEEQTSKMGMKVTGAEVSDMYTGTFVHAAVRQSFGDPQTGQVDVRIINNIVDQINDGADSVFADPSAPADKRVFWLTRQQWTEMEKYIKTDRELQKFNTIIESGFYMPNAIAKKVAEYGNTSANVKVVALPFQSVSDEEATIAEADYQAYYDNHKAEFRIPEEYRDIEFITFPVNPTQQDLADIQDTVEKLWAEFQTIDDSEIKYFVRNYDSTYVKASTFKAPLDAQIEAAAPGTFIAPAIVGNEWVMAKVLATAVRPDSLRASVIYILNSTAGGNITRSNDQAKALTDSVLALVKGNKMSFEQAVAQFSDDPQKEATQGDMDWQLDGNYGFINEDLVKTPVGSCFVCEHPQGLGYLLVKVTGKTPALKKYRVALFSYEIAATPKTDNAIYGEANKFAGRNRTAAEFTASAQQENLQVRSARLNMMANSISGISNARNIVQWAFNDTTKIGDVAGQVFSCDGMYVVVALKDVLKKGYVPLDQVRTAIEQPVRLEKKGEILMARAEEAMKAVKDLPSIAVKLNAAVDTIDSVSFNDYYFGRYGMEPKVLSAVAVSNEGALVGPVKGASGVYMLQIDSKAPKTVAEETVKMRLEQGYRSKTGRLRQVLRDAAKITDQRNKFF